MDLAPRSPSGVRRFLSYDWVVVLGIVAAWAGVVGLAVWVSLAHDADQPPPEQNTAGISAAWVNLPDGRVVTCVVLDARGGAIDCDWATAAREGETP